MCHVVGVQYKASLEAIGGYDIETGGKPLDPLKLAKWIPAETLRRYETVHCRVAMLACVGYAFPRECWQTSCCVPRVVSPLTLYINVNMHVALECRDLEANFGF